MGLLSRFAKAAAKGLDMSTEARMARAKAMGFDTERPAYRGLTREYDPNYAEDWLSYQMFDRSGAGASGYAQVGRAPNVVKAALRRGRSLEIDANGSNWDRIDTSSLPPEMRAALPSRSAISEIGTAAKSKGYDSLIVQNVIDRADGNFGPTTTIDVIFDPRNIRSVHAAFDPDEINSSDLLASFVPAIAGGGLLSMIGARGQRT